jgi:hypothetical protein
MPVTPQRRWSHRSRVIAPLSLAALAATRRFGAAAQEATPVPPAGSVFASMLGQLPLSTAGSADNVQLVTFADIAAQLAAVGVAELNSIDDMGNGNDWIRAILPLAIADPFARQAKILNRTLIGFDLSDVDQTMQAGEPPDMVSMLRGRFDHDAIAAAWAANGYQMVVVDGIQVASFSADMSFSPDNPIQRLTLNRLNNSAFLPDGTLVFTASLDTMRATIAAAAGTGPSLASRVDVVALLGAGDLGLATGVLFAGSAVAAAGQLPPDLTSATAVAEYFATEVASAGEMPPVALGLIGITPGGPLPNIGGTPESAAHGPLSMVLIRLLLAQQGTAERARDVVEKRAAEYVSVVSRQPLSDLFSSILVTADSASNTILLEMTPNSPAAVGAWSKLLFNRDLGFLAW